MEPVEFTRTDLVAFGAYLLSEERTNRIAGNFQEGDPVHFTERLKGVYHADVENFLASKEQTNG